MDTTFEATQFDIIDERGRRMRVRPAGRDDTVRELAAATGLARRRGNSDPAEQFVCVDGRPVPASTKLAVSGIRHGAHVTASPADHAEGRARVMGGHTRKVALWLAGPDAGATIVLQEGDNVIGRSLHADVRCDDRSLELHHAVLRLSGDQVTLTQLAGAVPLMIGGRAVEPGQVLAEETVIELGASLLVVRAAPARAGALARLDPVPGDPWRLTFVRRPRAVPDLPPLQIDAPRRGSATTGVSMGLAGPLLALAGAAVLAVLMHQLMFLAFGIMALFVAAGTGLIAKRRHAKDLRWRRNGERDQTAQFLEALDRQRQMFRRFHQQTTMHLDVAVRVSAQLTAKLWCVRADHPDAFRVALGRGSVAWQPNVSGITGDTTAEIRTAIDRASELHDVDVPVALGPGTVLGLGGAREFAAAAARSIIVQLAAATGPADWGLVVLGGVQAEWRGMDWLPHLVRTPAGDPLTTVGALVDAIGQETSTRHLVVIVTDPGLLASRTSPLRRLLASDRPPAVIVLCGDALPAACTASLSVGRDCRGKWNDNPHGTTFATPLHVAGLSVRAVEAVARQLAPLVDPERASGRAEAVPASVSLVQLLSAHLGSDPTQFAARIATTWRESADTDDLRAPLGAAGDGLVELDLVSDGPHGLIAGTTGSGKSELLRSLVLSLAARLSPERVNFVLVDYKGGSTFDGCAELPHVVGMVTDLDDGLAERALRSLDAELRRREHLLREHSAVDLASYRRDRIRGHHTGAPLPSLVVVIDEFATLAQRNPEFMTALLGIAQRGRSLGVHLLLATQRPHGVVTDDIRANTNLRISLRVQDEADSRDVIGDPQAAHLARHAPGRAVARLGADPPFVFQTACGSGRLVAAGTQRLCVEHLDLPVLDARTKQPDDDLAAGATTEIEVLVGAIRAAARGMAAPHRPWIPALPDVMPASAVAPTDVGMIDDPDHQRRETLRWHPGTGHLLLVGAVGSGTTTALLAIAGALVAHPGKRPMHLYVIDALGDGRWDAVAATPECAAVVRATEHERLGRLLLRLNGELERRRSEVGAPGADIVVLIDGYGSLRAGLQSDEAFDRLHQLEAIVADGQAVGISVALATNQPASAPAATLAQCAHRWVFHLADPLDASIVGLSPKAVPPAVAGRLVVFPSARAAQIVDRQFEPGSLGAEAVVPPPITRLSAQVFAGDLPPGERRGGVAIVPVGVQFDSLQPAVIEFAAGDHLLVLGSARTGRTETLRTLAASWLTLHPDGWLGSVVPRGRCPLPGRGFDDIDMLLAERPSPRPALVVLDDAELIDDPHGALAALIDRRATGITVVAAARPDSIRTMYGHWTHAVRRSRLGLLMVSANELDADLLHARLPRRLPLTPRPGLAWCVAHGQVGLVQLALTAPANGPILTNPTQSDEICTIS